MLEMVNKKIGMTTGRVQAGFLYARTRPVGLNPLPEPVPFNKWVFFFFFSNPKRALSRHAQPQITTQTQTQTQISKTQVSNL